MQKSSQDIILELSIKRAARKELRNFRRAKNQNLHEGPNSDFLTPFKNVLKALRLVAMDLSNSLRLVINLVITFDPEKIKLRIKEFDDRRQKINNEWKPIMDEADRVLGGQDPILMMAIMGPANFLTLQGAGVALTAGKTVAEVITATHWDQIIGSYSEQLDVGQRISKFYQNWFEDKDENRGDFEDVYDTTGGSTGHRRRARSLASRIASLFVEGKTGTPSINEQNEKKKAPELSEEQAIDMFVEATGLKDSFIDLRKKSMQNLKDAIGAILEDVKPTLAASQLMGAQNFEELKQAFQIAKQADPKLDPSTYEKFVKSVTDESTKLSSDKKFIEDLMKQTGKKQLEPNEITAAATNVVFKSAKEQFDAQVKGALKKVITVTGEAIKQLKIDDKMIAEMKKSSYSEIKGVLTIYEELLKVYKQIQDDYRSQGA